MLIRGITRLAAVVIALGVLQPAPAHADRVGKLAKMLSSSSNEKTRLAAVVSLAKLDTPAAVKPLVGALSDPNVKIRAVAAAALGRIGNQSALGPLRTLAADDRDERVRRLARDSAIAVAKKVHSTNPFEDAPAAKTAQVEPASPRAGFGNQPRVLENQPDLFIAINGANDDSPGAADKKSRKANAEIVRGVLASHCQSAPLVTMAAGEAKRFGLAGRHLDVSVVKLQLVRNGGAMELEAQLRVAISDDNGKMLSILAGGAKIQVPAKTYDPKYLPGMRKEVLESAMRGMADKILSHLRDTNKQV